MNQLLDLNNTLNLFFQAGAAVQTLWNLYIVAAVGVVGFMVASPSVGRQRRNKLFLTAAFLVFAFSNLYAQVQVQSQRHALADIVALNLTHAKDIPDKYETLEETIKPPPVRRVIAFHLGYTTLVSLAIWLIPRGKERETRS